MLLAASSVPYCNLDMPKAHVGPLARLNCSRVLEVNALPVWRQDNIEHLAQLNFPCGIRRKALNKAMRNDVAMS